MDLSIITVTWNSEKQIAEQIASVISACGGLDCEQIVIDNGSKDKTVEIIEGASRDLPIQLIKNKDNKGFAKANNQGVEIATGKYILFLNPDMRLEDVKPLGGHVPRQGSLEKLVRWFEDKKDVGIASCKLVNKKGEFNLDTAPRRFPKVWEQVLVLLKVPHFLPMFLNQYLMRDFNPEVEQEVDSVRGSFMLVRRELIDKLGWGFDPRYFFWWEDVDLCREAKRLEYKVMYTPIISCIDYFGTSFSKRKRFWAQRNFTKSMLQYFKKWEPMRKWIWIAIFRPIGVGLAFLFDLFF
ncbi:MAG: glycosyltransferase family 2 protein [Candidatus Magasanikbacteria bacterium]